VSAHFVGKIAYPKSRILAEALRRLINPARRIARNLAARSLQEPLQGCA
jgi:hypothetical protein